MALYVYVDNSNVWIGGQQLAAVRAGLAPNVDAARELDLEDRTWQHDFGDLHRLSMKGGESIARALLIGSKPRPDDKVWQQARADGFEVEVFERAGSGEKEVDTSIVRYMIEDSYEKMQAGDLAVLISGDRDFLPAVESLAERGFPTRVVAWEFALSSRLREAAAEFVPLDPWFDELTV